MDEKLIELIFEEFDTRTERPAIELESTEGGSATVAGTKFGGAPYLPKGFAYPLCEDESGEQVPMVPVAQINFGELPNLEGFPTEGILQFYIDRKWAGSKVIYHPSVLGDIEQPPSLDGVRSPVSREIPLTGQVEKVPLPFCNEPFDEEFMEVFRKHVETDAESVHDLEEYEDICDDFFHGEGHRIGGYAHFNQADVQSYNPQYDTLLLQMDLDDGVTWGDSGTAHWFISGSALAAQRFDDIFFHWDCM